MSISVIIPAYNYAHFLPRTLGSVLGQSIDAPVEVIIVDDGSTDDTAKVAASFGNRVRYIYQHNQGHSAARNTGIAHASGEALVFLDADDLILPGALQSQWDTLCARGADMSVCMNTMVDAPQPYSPLRVIGHYPLLKHALPLHLCHANPAPIHAYLVRRGLVQAAGGFDTSLEGCEDYDFWWRCFLAGGQAVCNPHAWVIYRKHTASVSAHIGRQAHYEALCNARVGQDLRLRQDFLPDRRPDAFIAHAAGSLKRATLSLPYDVPLTIGLLDQAASAVRTALRVGAVDAFANRDHARSQDDMQLLRYYALRTLGFMQSFDTVPHSKLKNAHDALTRLLFSGAVPLNFFAAAEDLHKYIFIIPDIAALLDSNGFLCADV